MFIEKNIKITERLGEITGFLLMYFIFTTILYFLLKWLDKIPDSWSFIYISMITLFIVLLGFLINILLKS